MLIKTNITITVLLAISFMPTVFAFDDDTSINNINLSPENFLDIKANRLRQSLQHQWYDATNGWRMTGGSLDANRLFLQTELKFQHDLSATNFIRMQLEQEVFYAPKPLPPPLIDLGLYPWNGKIGISGLATFAHDKRQMDLGMAIIIGRRPWDYVRFAWLQVDSTYNAKNEYSDAYYSEQPETLDFTGAYRFLDHYKLRFSFIKERPLQLVTPQDSAVFNHKETRYEITLDYQYKDKAYVGIGAKGLELQKSRQNPSEDRHQDTQYTSIDLYWLNFIDSKYELTVGTQWDSIKNRLQDNLDDNQSLQYSMRTWQVYGILHRDYSIHQGWDLGLYLGQVDEKEDYISNTRQDIPYDGIESKFRTSWQYHSIDKNYVLLVHISFNLDDLIDDPTDGGGLSFQGTF